MSLVLLTVIIEKAGDHYTAYSPNLPGVSVTAAGREDVERQMLESIERYIKDLGARHESASRPITVAPGRLDEVIPCVFTTQREFCGNSSAERPNYTGAS